MVIPPPVDRPADPDRAHPRPAGHRPRLPARDGRSATATSSTSARARRRSRTRLLGAADPRRRAAARALGEHGPGDQRRRSIELPARRARADDGRRPGPGPADQRRRCRCRRSPACGRRCAAAAGLARQPAQRAHATSSATSGLNVVAGVWRGRRATTDASIDARHARRASSTRCATAACSAARAGRRARRRASATTASTTSSGSPTRSSAGEYTQRFALTREGARLDRRRWCSP